MLKDSSQIIIYMIYVISLINIITFFVYGLDKLKAINHWWRIPEWVLLGLAVAGCFFLAVFLPLSAKFCPGALDPLLKKLLGRFRRGRS